MKLPKRVQYTWTKKGYIMAYLAKLYRVGNGHAIILPRLLLSELQWTPGQYLELRRTNNGAVTITNWSLQHDAEPRPARLAPRKHPRT